MINVKKSVSVLVSHTLLLFLPGISCGGPDINNPRDVSDYLGTCTDNRELMSILKECLDQPVYGGIRENIFPLLWALESGLGLQPDERQFIAEQFSTLPDAQVVVPEEAPHAPAPVVQYHPPAAPAPVPKVITYRVRLIHPEINRIIEGGVTVDKAKGFLNKFCLTPDGQVRTDICIQYRKMVQRLYDALNSPELPDEENLGNLIYDFTQYTNPYDSAEFYEDYRKIACEELLKKQKAEKRQARINAQPLADPKDYKEFEAGIQDLEIPFRCHFPEQDQKYALAKFTRFIDDKKQTGWKVNEMYARNVQNILDASNRESFLRNIDDLLDKVQLHNYRDVNGEWKTTFRRGCEFFLAKDAD